MNFETVLDDFAPLFLRANDRNKHPLIFRQTLERFHFPVRNVHCLGMIIGRLGPRLRAHGRASVIKQYPKLVRADDRVHGFILNGVYGETSIVICWELFFNLTVARLELGTISQLSQRKMRGDSFAGLIKLFIQRQLEQSGSLLALALQYLPSVVEQIKSDARKKPKKKKSKNHESNQNTDSPKSP